jgi:hypothetical protein
MGIRQIEKPSGYELWHRRLGHTSNRTIRETIQCAVGLEFLKKMTFETHVKCPSYLIGKATLEDFPNVKRPINNPIYQVHMDSFSSSVKSIEGYNYAIIFVDAGTDSRNVTFMERIWMTQHQAMHGEKRDVSA